MSITFSYQFWQWSHSTHSCNTSLASYFSPFWLRSSSSVIYTYYAIHRKFSALIFSNSQYYQVALIIPIQFCKRFKRCHLSIRSFNNEAKVTRHSHVRFFISLAQCNDSWKLQIIIACKMLLLLSITATTHQNQFVRISASKKATLMLVKNDVVALMHHQQQF